MNPPDKDLILSFYDSYVNDWLEHNKKRVDQIDQEAKDRSELGLPLDLASHFKPRPTTMWNENKTLTRIKIAREMLLTLCKKDKHAVIFEMPTKSGIVQYIGNGAALYPAIGLPLLDKESLLTIFDIPERQREDWFVRIADITSEINLNDIDADEKLVEREAISIIYSGKTLKPLQTRRGLVFIESRYLAPVSDVLDVLELYERITPSGMPYIVAKAGFLLQAVIMPYKVISQQFVDKLKKLTEQCVLSLKLLEKEEAGSEEPERYSLNIDPTTGEITGGESENEDETENS